MSNNSYEDDLRERIRQAREFLAAYEGKAIGPYHIQIEICGSRWGDVVKQLASFMDIVTRGPDHPMGQCGGGYGDTYSRLILKKGEEVTPNQPWHPDYYKVYG